MDYIRGYKSGLPLQKEFVLFYTEVNVKIVLYTELSQHRRACGTALCVPRQATDALGIPSPTSPGGGRRDKYHNLHPVPSVTN